MSRGRWTHTATRNPGLAVTTLALIAGGIVALADVSWARVIWTSGVIFGGAPLVWRTALAGLRGRFATDVVASLAIIGAIALGQPLAGLIIVLMQTGGEALERYAEGKASAALEALERAAPRVAHVERAGTVLDVAVTDVVVGDLLVVRPGDVLPCDGEIVDGRSDLDTSSLTGEPMPRPAYAGSKVMSGMINGSGSFRYRATAVAAQSQYATIVKLVRDAQGSKAPLQRLADRYAAWFTPVTIAACAIAAALTRDGTRVLAILVVATPCPLILATPVALIGGINRAARHFIIIRSGGAMERLASVDTAVFDKTGTLTVGKPRVERVSIAPAFDRARILSAAAALEARSSHLLARVIVEAVEAEGLSVEPSGDHEEVAGLGVAGTVQGERVLVGARAYVLPQVRAESAVTSSLENPEATLQAYVAVGGRLAGVIEFADRVRPGVPELVTELRQQGIDEFVLLSGDSADAVQRIAARAGIDEASGDLRPADKAAFIRARQAGGRRVMMVGDGINDAPALSAADVGVALASQNAGIAAEAADVVILVDSIAPVAYGIRVARRAMRIAKQSIWAGLSLSAAAMIVAGLGALPPALGAALQEAIDVAVILNALRASGEPEANDTVAPARLAGRRRTRTGAHHVSTIRA